MTIAEAREKCKTTLSLIPRDVLIIVIIFLASSASFGLGMLAVVLKDKGLKMHRLRAAGLAPEHLFNGQPRAADIAPVPAARDAGQGRAVVQEEAVSVATSTTGKVVASKNGTKYYLPGCTGADRISEANKVWFSSDAAAIKAGYTLAANCKGL